MGCMEFIHQEATDLVLGIVTHPLPFRLQSLQSTDLIIEDWHFTFQIIGESHAVLVKKAERLVWQEILACIPLHPDACYHYQAFPQLAAHHFHNTHYKIGVTFRFNSAENLPLLENPQLSHTFPSQSPAAITQISWQVAETWVKWQTVHSYPSDNQVITVHTASEFNYAQQFDRENG